MPDYIPKANYPEGLASKVLELQSQRVNPWETLVRTVGKEGGKYFDKKAAIKKEKEDLETKRVDEMNAAAYKSFVEGDAEIDPNKVEEGKPIDYANFHKIIKVKPTAGKNRSVSPQLEPVGSVARSILKSRGIDLPEGATHQNLTEAVMAQDLGTKSVNTAATNKDKLEDNARLLRNDILRMETGIFEQKPEVKAMISEMKAKLVDLDAEIVGLGGKKSGNVQKVNVPPSKEKTKTAGTQRVTVQDMASNILSTKNIKEILADPKIGPAQKEQIKQGLIKLGYSQEEIDSILLLVTK